MTKSTEGTFGVQMAFYHHTSNKSRKYHLTNPFIAKNDENDLKLPRFMLTSLLWIRITVLVMSSQKSFHEKAKK